MAEVTLIREAPFEVDPLRLHLGDPDFYPCLLQSTASGTQHGRYDILFAAPAERVVLDGRGQLLGHGGERFLQALDTACAGDPVAVGEGLPFAGGWFLLLGYELASEVEPSLRLPRPASLPVAVAVRSRAALIRDRFRQRSWIVAETGQTEALARIHQDLQQAGPPARSGALLQGAVAEPAGTDYLEAVAAAKDYIRAGDIFQANLSREWTGRLAPGTWIRPTSTRRLRETLIPALSPAWRCLTTTSVISSSPESAWFPDCEDRIVQTRPIAGTRPRTGSDPQDNGTGRCAKPCCSNPKERAEHIMLIDLERNDLGRVCAGRSRAGG